MAITKTRKPQRYLVSRKEIKKFAKHPEQVHIHDTSHLSEQCNTDQIRKRRHSDLLTDFTRLGFALCQHCFPADPEPVPEPEYGSSITTS